MNKICTSIEQSQKLIELGINITTADMYYVKHSLENYYSPIPLIGKYSEIHNQIPAWSLSSLLILTPNEILINDEYYYLNLNKTKIEYRGPVTFDGQKSKSIECNNLVDAAFEMVVWLKENNKL